VQQSAIPRGIYAAMHPDGVGCHIVREYLRDGPVVAAGHRKIADTGLEKKKKKEGGGTIKKGRLLSATKPTQWQRHGKQSCLYFHNTYGRRQSTFTQRSRCKLKLSTAQATTAMTG
jgi:hypothetical protein